MNHKRFLSFIQLRNASTWIAKFLIITIISMLFFHFILQERVSVKPAESRIQDTSLNTLLSETFTLMNEIKYFSFSCPTLKFNTALQNLTIIDSYVQDYAADVKQTYSTIVQTYKSQLTSYHYLSCVLFERNSFSTVSPYQSTSYGSAISSGDFTSYAMHLENAINTKYDVQSERISLTSSLQFKNINFNRDMIHLSFISKYGVTVLNKLASERFGKSFLTWLFNNPDVMNEFLLGGDPSGGNALQALKIWMDIWSTDPESTRSLYLTLAQAVALVHANPLTTEWYHVDDNSNPTTIDPLRRYLNFKNAHKAKKLYPLFDTLDVEHMRMVVNAAATDADLDWAREAYTKPRIVVNERGVLRNLTKMYDQDTIGYAAEDLEYNLDNAKGISVFDGTLAYYGPDATLESVLKVGGVCGAIAKYSSVVSQAYGVPALPVAQPGHAAMMFYKSDRSWDMYYDIFGLGESTTHDFTYIPWSQPSSYGPSYIFLYEAAVSKNPAQLALSLRLGLLANKLTDVKLAQEVRQKAIELSPLAIPVWRDYISTVKQDSALSITSYLSLSSQIINDFRNQPRAMAELLGLIEEEIKNLSDFKTLVKYVQDVTQTYHTIRDSQQQQIELNVSKLLPYWYADYLLVPIASTFSLTTLPTGQIQINNITSGMSYSVDNGVTFTYPIIPPDQQTYELPEEDQKLLSMSKTVWVRYKYVTSTDASKAVILNLP